MLSARVPDSDPFPPHIRSLKREDLVIAALKERRAQQAARLGIAKRPPDRLPSFWRVLFDSMSPPVRVPDPVNGVSYVVELSNPSIRVRVAQSASGRRYAELRYREEHRCFFFPTRSQLKKIERRQGAIRIRFWQVLDDL